MGTEIHKLQEKVNRIGKTVRCMALRHLATEKVMRRGRLQLAWLLLRVLFVEDALIKEVVVEEHKIVAKSEVKKRGRSENL